MHPKSTTNQTFSSCPPSTISTATASSPSSRPSAPAASSVPQPMDLDHTHPVKRDPCHGLCFNCGKPGHIMKVCQGPHAQNVQNVDAMMILRLAPKDLQFLMESLRLTVTPSMPVTPPPELCRQDISPMRKSPIRTGFDPP